LYLNSTGKDETNTIFRAEMVAIQYALLAYSRRHTLTILTDCRPCIQALRSALRGKMHRAYHHHSALIMEVTALLRAMLEEGSLTAIHRTPAHVGVPGNEAADVAAKFAAKHPEGLPGYPVLRASLGAEPHPPPVLAIL
jgi:ribonuclease HI